MDQHVKRIFYLSMTGPAQKRERTKRKDPLPILRCERRYPFLTENDTVRNSGSPSGALQLYFGLLPFAVKEEMNRSRKRRRWIRKLSDSLQFVQENLGIGQESVVFSYRLCEIFERRQHLPEELFAVCLRTCREREAFRCVNLSLPEECGGETVEEAVRLLSPYLSRINSLVMVGEESESAWQIEDYLYDEYGIVTSYARRPEKNAIWLDLGSKPLPLLASFAMGNGICHINEAEVLNFLDTAVKSGYNTKVN
ncbi:MAG: hypothetical protein HFI46_05270 [Lachnospiraceae bacterium]|nr:hypothetical protein [Lachnospiraceae bacterium]